jgi:hypothetical protein
MELVAQFPAQGLVKVALLVARVGIFGGEEMGFPDRPLLLFQIFVNLLVALPPSGFLTASKNVGVINIHHGFATAHNLLSSFR